MNPRRGSRSAVVGPPPVPPETSEPASVPIVTSVVRATRILEAVAESDTPLAAGALARQLGLPRSTTLGLCVTLAKVGLLHRDADGLYRLGRTLFSLSQTYADRIDLVDQFQSVCRELRVLPAETLLLSVRDGRHIVSVANRTGSNLFGLEISIGRRVPAHATAMGKALLATLTDEELAALYEGRTLERLTDSTVDNVPELLRQVATARELGYATDDEESVPGLGCIGVPVLRSRPYDRPVAVGAVAVAFVKAAVDEDFYATALEGVQAVAHAISERLP